MLPGFEWDQRKAVINQRKHGVSFFEAVTVFGDPRLLLEYDESHSMSEDHFAAIGWSERSRLLLVVHCEHRDVTRIIGARKAIQAERARYAGHL